LMGFAAFFEEDVDEVVDEVLGEEDDDEPPLVVVVVPEGLVAVEAELEAVVEIGGPSDPDAVEFKQLVLVPAITVTAAVCPVNPLLSLTVNPMLVPADSSTAVQVNSVEFTCPN